MGRRKEINGKLGGEINEQDDTTREREKKIKEKTRKTENKEGEASFEKVCQILEEFRR